MSSRIFRNSEAFASELLEHLEDMFILRSLVDREQETARIFQRVKTTMLC